MSLLRVRLSALRQTTLRQCVLRFVFGGVMTVAAGLIVKTWGPAVGGLFLAFPAIFPAQATLLEKHERKKKEVRGEAGRARGRAAVAIDATGAALGAIGLASFGALVRGLAPHHGPVLVLAAAVGLWLAVSSGLWVLRRRARAFRRRAQA